MTELAVPGQAHVGATDLNDARILSFLGLNPKDPRAVAVVAVARRYDLDPLLKHVVMIVSKKHGTATVYITRDGYLHVAHSSGVLDGIVVEQEPTLSDDGKEWQARVSVWRKDMGHPFTYPGRYPVDGANEDYPQEMALKAAESHALRRAFNVAGLPSYEERRGEDAVVTAPAVRQPAPRPKTIREAVRGPEPKPTPEPTQPAAAADEADLFAAADAQYEAETGGETPP